MPPVFHTYADTLSLPSDVLELIQGLDRPLPSRLKSVLQEHEKASLSPLAKQQLLQIPPGSCCCSRDDAATLKLLDVLDTTLLTCAGIQEQIRVRDEFGTRPTSTHWHMLLRTLSRVCYAESRVLADVPFVQPRDFEGEEGTASMLIGFAADPSTFLSYLHRSSTKQSSLKEQSSEEERTSISTSESTDDRGRGSLSSWLDRISEQPAIRAPDDADILFGLDQDSEQDVVEEEWLDIPLEAHMLAGKEHSSFVLFPLICVAEQQHIVPLVATTACHRYVWGQRMPAVGFQISKYGNLVETYIAWIDTTPGSTQMPEIHILSPAIPAVGARLSSNPQQGTFDLADPRSILQLALFILSIGPQFQILEQELPPQFSGRLLWRADQSHIVSSDSNITGWLQSIDAAVTDDASIPHQGDAPASTASITGLDPNVSPNLDADSAANSSQKSSNPSVQSAKSSRITLRGPDAASISSWMTQRFAFSLSRIDHLDDISQKKPEGFDAMTDLYNEMTSFQSIEGWNGEDWKTATPIDKCFNDQWDALSKGYTDLVRVSTESPNSVLKQMHNAHANILVNRLSLLFQAIDGSLTRQAQKIQANEEGSQREWDALLQNFYISEPGEATSDTTLLEETLRLPKNTLYEAIHSVNRSMVLRPVNDLIKDEKDLEAVNGHQQSDSASSVISETSRDAAGNGSRKTSDIPQEFVNNHNVGVPDPETLRSPANGMRLCGRLVNDLEEHAKHLRAVSQCYRKHLTELGIAEDDSFFIQCSQAMRVITMQRYKYEDHEIGWSRKYIIAMVNDNHAEEPRNGPCAAVLFIRKPLRIDAARVEQAKEAYVKCEFVITESEALSRNPQREYQAKSEPLKTDLGRQCETISETSRDTASDNQGESLLRQFATEGSLSSAIIVDDKTTSISPGICDFQILLPQLLVSYNSPESAARKSLNEARMFCVSAITYLAAIGITDYPVFGLATYGPIGAVIMVWRTKQGKSYSMDRNVRTFDLRRPVEAFQFASFLVRLRARDKVIEETFKPLEEELKRRLLGGEIPEWAVPLQGAS